MKAPFLIIISFYVLNSYGQLLPKEFINYEDVITETKSSDNPKELKDKFDYYYVLLLDSTELDLIQNIDPQAISYYREVSPGLKNSEQFGSYKVAEKSIKDVLKNESLLKKVIISIDKENRKGIENSEIEKPIYTNENKAIIFNYGSFWSNTYFLELVGNEIKIKWLVGTIQ